MSLTFETESILKRSVAAASSESYTVQGNVFLDNEFPAKNILLLIYDINLGTKTLLGKSKTNNEGYFKLIYNNPSNKVINLQVFTLDLNQKEIALSDILLNVTKDMSLKLIAPENIQVIISEYQWLITDLKNTLGSMKLADLQENDKARDLSQLYLATGWDARLISLASIAAKLSSDPTINLPEEALYGLLRLGFPDDKFQLANNKSSVIEEALNKAKNANIIGLTEPGIANVKTQFENFSKTVRLNTPAPGSQFTYGQLLQNSGLNKEAQQSFAKLYLEHQGTTKELWSKASANGIKESDIQALQNQGKLAYLTQNNNDLIGYLQFEFKITSPVQLIDLGFFKAEMFETILKKLARTRYEAEFKKLRVDHSEAEVRKLIDENAILTNLIPPAFVEEGPEERLKAYTEDMARKLRLSYPTQVLKEYIKRDASNDFNLGPDKNLIVAFLSKAVNKGFKLGQTATISFIEQNPDTLPGLEASIIESQKIKTNLNNLQRIYQITPSLEAMQLLLKLRFHSANDLIAIPKEIFLARYGQLFPPLQAELIYHKAEQVATITYNLFTMTKSFDNAPEARAFSGAIEDRVSLKEETKATLIKQFPSLESLFGSLDYCECEHCRSALSPAAYFVDLLQFLENDKLSSINKNQPAEMKAFLLEWKRKHNEKEYKAPYEALLERRPDLPEIELSCENTLVALPYIDLVNEILEYYLATHGSHSDDSHSESSFDDVTRERITTYRVHNNPEGDTSEFLAEPQHILPEAYNKLLNLYYPLSLPFDLWLETTREFTQFCKTPLWKILDSFKETEALFEPHKPYDQAAIFIEQLGLSPSEYQVLTDPYLLEKWFSLYGYDNEESATKEERDPNTKQRIDLNAAKTLVRRLGISYQELVDILATSFVNPKLETLASLKKLGLTLQDVFFYRDNKALKEAYDNHRVLSLEEKNKLEEVKAFEERLKSFNRVTFPGFNEAWLYDKLEAGYFDDLLILADNNLGSSFDETNIRYAALNKNKADAFAFLKINLFVRLWRKLGLSIEETDQALQAFIPKNSPMTQENLKGQPLKSTLIYLAHFRTFCERLKIKKNDCIRFLTLWSLIPRTGKQAVYQTLFLQENPLKTNLIFDDPLGNYNLNESFLRDMAELQNFEAWEENVPLEQKIDPSLLINQTQISLAYDDLRQVQYLSYRGILNDTKKAELFALSSSPILAKLLEKVQQQAIEFFLIKGHATSLQAALELSFAEMELILRDDQEQKALVEEVSLTEEQLNIGVAEAKFSLNNLSLLYRYRLLAKALQLSIQELISLKKLSSLNPFKALATEPLKALEQDYLYTETLAFLDIVDIIKTTGLKIEDLSYYLQHQFDPMGKYRQNDEAKLKVIKTLSTESDLLRKENELELLHLKNEIISTEKDEIILIKRLEELSKAAEEKLQGQLKQFIIQSMSALYNHAETSLIETLLTDINVLGDTKPLWEVFCVPLENIEKNLPSYQLFDKAVQLLLLLQVNNEELLFFCKETSGSLNFNLKKIPLKEKDLNPIELKSIFAQFLRLAKYLKLKNELGVTKENFIAIFKEEDSKKAYAELARLTRRKEDFITVIARILFGVNKALNLKLDENNLRKIWDILLLVERFGTKVEAIQRWTGIVDKTKTPLERFTITQELRASIKGRFSKTTWLNAVKPLADKLRQLKRNALVDALVHQLNFDRQEQLYEFFLIEPAMEPVVQTSRIRLAIGSVQLFIQRCLLNLEEQVSPSAFVNVKIWDWMKHYRIWEANRKIFLFPENWLEPEFRDSKTHLCKQLESDLLKNEISNDLVESAFFNYLQKLEELARLEIVGMYCEDKEDPSPYTLHIIGRNYNEPYKYFYRKFSHGVWTPWEPVNLQMDGDHIAPVIWRNRLYLFWVTFNFKPFSEPNQIQDGNESGEKMPLSKVAASVQATNSLKLLDMQLHWAECFQGVWSAIEISGVNTPDDMLPAVFQDFDKNSVFITIEKDKANSDKQGITIHLKDYNENSNTFYHATGYFYLPGRNYKPTFIQNKNFSEIADIIRYKTGGKNPNLDLPIPYSPTNLEAFANRYKGTGPLAVQFTQKLTTIDGKSSALIQTSNILQKSNSYTILTSNNQINLNSKELASLITPFFYQDNQSENTFFVEPNITEKTLEDWLEWIVPVRKSNNAPIFDSLKQNPDLIKRITAKPPKSLFNVDNNLTKLASDSKALYKLQGKQDWLVNANTAVSFKGEIVGAIGKATIATPKNKFNIVNSSNGFKAGSAVANLNRVNLRSRIDIRELVEP